MKKVVFTFIVLFFSTSSLYGEYKYDDPNLGNIAIEGRIWNASLDGQITNPYGTSDGLSTIDFQDDLAYKEENTISSFNIDVKNNWAWMPNLNLDYFAFSESANGEFNEDKIIGEPNNVISSGKILSNTDYSEVNLKAYGYLQQSIMEFNLGLDFKKITYEQTIENPANTDSNQTVTIKGPEEFMVVPYIAVKFDLYPINTVLKAETSLLSFGDDEARSYSYSLNYRIMRHMYIGYGYRYTSFKSSNVNNSFEKYDVQVKGNYISAKILF